MRRLLPVASGAEEPFEGYGTIVSVETRWAGTELVGDHSIGVEALQVQDVSLLPGTGVVNVGGGIDRSGSEAVLIGGVEVAYTATDDLSDPDTTATEEALILEAATVDAFDDRTIVTLTPLSEYKEALVVLDAAPGTAITCLVDHRIEDALEEGPRVDGTGEIVWVRQRRGELGLTVETVKGRRKKVDAKYVSPGTLPAAAVDHDDFAANATIVTILNSTNSSAVPVQNLRMQNGFGPTLPKFFVRPDGTGSWDGLESVPPIIAAYLASLPVSGIDGGIL